MSFRAYAVFAALLLSQAAHAIVVTTVAVDPADDERSAKRFQAALARNNVRNLQILEFREDDQALADGFVAFAKKFKATDAQKTVDVSAGFLMVKGPRYFRLVGIHPDGMTEDLFGFEDEKLRMVTIPYGENAGLV